MELRKMNGSKGSKARAHWLWALGLGWLLIIIMGIFLHRSAKERLADSTAIRAPAGDSAAPAPGREYSQGAAHKSADAFAPKLTAEQTVADKLQRFARSRRSLVHALAKKRGIVMPDGVEQFFDAVEAGHWKEIQARYAAINGNDPSGTTLTSARPAGLESLWPAIHDTYGAAQTVQRWPAQELLDYGNAVLSSLRPGMVYLGGTDGGRWIPELLNDSSDGQRHIILTQNALADPNYLNYVNLQYDGQFTALTAEDSGRSYQDYLADYQKRLAHDQQFPEEPKQIRPGESDGIRLGDDGQLQVYGPKSAVATMGINEQLLLALLQRNPGFSFAMEDAFPMPSMQANAAPLGPIMELRAVDEQNSASADDAAQALAYWQAATQQLLADPDASSASDAYQTYAHDMTAQARLFRSQHLDAQAEEAFALANELTPANPEVISQYTDLLVTQKRFEDARQLLKGAVERAPQNQWFQGVLAQLSQQH